MVIRDNQNVLLDKRRRVAGNASLAQNIQEARTDSNLQVPTPERGQVRQESQQREALLSRERGHALLLVREEEDNHTARRWLRGQDNGTQELELTYA